MAVSEPGTTAWTATSISPGVCAIAQGGSASIFKVTASGIGKTTLTIQGKIGNSTAILCTVK